MPGGKYSRRGGSYRIRQRQAPRRDDRVRDQRTIRVREVRVIDETGQQLGTMAPQDAIRIARSKGLDLVEVSATAVPPVCRITDYGRYQYNEQKRRGRREAPEDHRGQGDQFRPKVDEHDYDFKKKHIERFLAEGDKAKATVFFRGLEIAHPGDRPAHSRAADPGGQRDRDAGERAEAEGNTMHTILGPRSRRWRRSGGSGEPQRRRPAPR